MESYLPDGKARERGQCHEIFYPGFLNQSTVSGISERCWIRERLNRRGARQEGVGQDGHKAGGRWTGRTYSRRDARRRDADRNLPL